MFSNLRKRLEDGLDAVEAMAAGNVQGSPRMGRQDSVSSFTDASSVASAPERHSLDGSSPQAQHSPSFNYLPYQPRAAAQLADSAMNNLRRSLSLQRSASVNSGHSEHSPLERKSSRGLPGTNGGSDREVSPVQAPTPRRPVGISLEERLRANFTIGEASGSPSPARQSTPLAKLPQNTAEQALTSLEPASIALPDSRPSSPQETTTPIVSDFPSGQSIDPTSVHLPTSPPVNNSTLSSIHQVSGDPYPRTLLASAVTLHPLSPPPTEPAHPPDVVAPNEHTATSAPTSQNERLINRPPNIVVDVSAPQSTIVTPSDFATAESRSDITDGTPVDNLHLDAINNSLLGVEAQNTPSSANDELPPDTAPVVESAVETSLPIVEEHHDEPTMGENGLESGSEEKLRDRLKVVEERFSGE
ncbi:vesicle-mediated transport [Ceratobasidium sp. AG-Ba]|nr:vesicle-mediated transport [Ceratobasidium sp. AG-Ba]